MGLFDEECQVLAGKWRDEIEKSERSVSIGEAGAAQTKEKASANEKVEVDVKVKAEELQKPFKA